MIPQISFMFAGKNKQVLIVAAIVTDAVEGLGRAPPKWCRSDVLGCVTSLC